MPTITYTGGVITTEQKKELIKKITEVCTTVTGTPKEYFAVVIHELNDDNLGLGGEQATEIKKKLALNS